MKKNLLLLASVFMLASCATKSYVQIVDVESKSVTKTQNNFVYTDDNCKVTYNFWTDGGDPGFVIENTTDKILYLDLEKSFFLFNDNAADYYLNRTYGKAQSRSASKAVTASAGMLGLWSSGLFGAKQPGYKSASASVAAAAENSSSVTYEEKSIIAIPPHASKTVHEYRVMDGVIQNCSVNLFAKKKKPQSLNFTEESTPLHFGNYITYKLGEDGQEKHIVNKFYIEGITNYNSVDVVEQSRTGCKNQRKAEYNKFQNGTKFFVRYNKAVDNAYSADAVK